MFGFIGMILAVPFFAVIYPIFVNYVHDRLKLKNMPVNASEYYPTDPRKADSPKTPEAAKENK